MDCQVRTMWLDFTGGRCFLNSVVAYQKPTFALTMNVYAIPSPQSATRPTLSLSLVISPLSLQARLRRAIHR
jgi:hypothetical protein